MDTTTTPATDKATHRFALWIEHTPVNDQRGRPIRPESGPWVPAHDWEQFSLPGTILMRTLHEPWRYADMPLAVLDGDDSVYSEYQQYLDFQKAFRP